MISYLLALSLTTSGAALQSDSLTRFTFSEYHMGIDALLVVYAPNKTVAENACGAAFERLAELDSMMSDYRQDSELMRLCDKAGGQPVPISKDLMTVFTRAQEVSSQTEGAFDITVGPLVLLWRKARKSKVLPTQNEIDAARQLVGWKNLKLDAKAHTAQLLIPGMKLDLGGIAKGYAGDEVQKVLRKFGITRALVELGGDVVVTGPPPGATGWRVRVPNAGAVKAVPDLNLANCAISSSGDTEQGVMIGGKVISHVIDPRTGQALTNRIQASVIAANGFTTDPLSKIFALLSPSKAAEVMKSYPGAKSYVRVLPTK